MLKQARFLVVAVFAVMACGSLRLSLAHAGDGATISWEEFKYRCTDEKDKPLNKQLKPENIRIVCTNIEREFVPAQPGSFALEANRHVVTSVYSSKFNVEAMGRDYPNAAAKASGHCMRYKEVERTIQITKAVSCGEILGGIKGDINDYCADNLAMVKGTSPKFIEQRETGRVYDTCGGGHDGGKK